MIPPADRASPLRWYLAALLLGLLISLLDPNPFLKFQTQRLAEVLAACGLLAWCFRGQPRHFFDTAAISG